MERKSVRDVNFFCNETVIKQLYNTRQS